MYTMSFFGSKEKIRRAKIHGEHINMLIQSYGLEENRTILRADKEPQSSYHLLTVASIPDNSAVLPDIALGLSDFVNNLRSALDYMTFQFALFNKDGKLTNENAVQFPIGDTTNSFQDQARRYLGEVHADHVAFIKGLNPVTSWQDRPYESFGNPMVHPLTWLRNFSNRDKHRFIQPVLTYTNLIGTYFENVRAYQILSIQGIWNPGLPLEVGTEVTRYAYGGPTPLHVDVAGYMEATVVTGDMTLISTAIRSLEDFVETAIKEAEGLPLPP